MFARECVRQRRDQHRDRMRRHVQAVSDEREGAESDSAADFDQHHRGAESDDSPRFSFVLRMPSAKKDVRVPFCPARAQL